MVRNSNVEYSVVVKLNSINPLAEKVMNISDPKFGTIYLESYSSFKGYNEVYAAGFCVDNNITWFYINENL